MSAVWLWLLAFKSTGHHIINFYAKLCDVVPFLAFLAHTPRTLVYVSVTATKFWIGGAGSMSTHAVVLAKLVVKGAEFGLNWFIVGQSFARLRLVYLSPSRWPTILPSSQVPLRSPDGRVVKGVRAGDVGAKMVSGRKASAWRTADGIVLAHSVDRPSQGRNGLDNGWIQFQGVKVPRDNMLQRYSLAYLSLSSISLLFWLQVY